MTAARWAVSTRTSPRSGRRSRSSASNGRGRTRSSWAAEGPRGRRPSRWRGATSRSGRAARRDARNSRPVTLVDGSPYLLAALWAIVGGGAGWVVRWGSVRLARMEGLEPGHRRWQEFGPPILCAVVFAVFALVITP